MVSGKTVHLPEVKPRTCRIAVKIHSVKRAILNQGPPCPPGDIWQYLGTDSIVTTIAIFTTLYVAFWCSRKKSFESVTMGQNSGIHFQCFKIFVKILCITPNYIERWGTEQGNHAPPLFILSRLQINVNVNIY